MGNDAQQKHNEKGQCNLLKSLSKTTPLLVALALGTLIHFASAAEEPLDSSDAGAQGVVKMLKDTQDRREFYSPVNYSPCTGDCIPFYENGNYHLLILNNGGWDHLKSKDLINWEKLHPVLDKGKPDETDGEWCFTGHIMEHEGTFHIFYPGVNRKHPKGNMCMMHATSKDMVNFTKHHERTWWPDGIHYKTKAQSDHHGSVEHPSFKDQFVVWNEKEKKWWMFFSAEAIGVATPTKQLPQFCHFCFNERK